MKNIFKKLLSKVGNNLSFSEKDLLEKIAILNGKQLALAHSAMPSIYDLSHAEFKVFSQFGEDGIIDWLVSKLPTIPQIFIEFGVENYQESNTRFLLMNRNWRGLVIDGSNQCIDYIKNSNLLWRSDLTASANFLTAENINTVFKQNNFVGDIGILSIDIDGNDYWVWEAITTVNPAIVISEYSSTLGDVFPITTIYKPDFDRYTEHYSGQYVGPSLPALIHLATKKGYTFIGTASTGINAFFIRNDLYPEIAKHIQHINSYPVRFSDTKDETGKLTFLRSKKRLQLIEDLSVMNVETGEEQVIKQLGELYSPRWLDFMEGKV